MSEGVVFYQFQTRPAAWAFMRECEVQDCHPGYPASDMSVQVMEGSATGRVDTIAAAHGGMRREWIARTAQFTAALLYQSAREWAEVASEAASDLMRAHAEAFAADHQLSAARASAFARGES